MLPSKRKENVYHWWKRLRVPKCSRACTKRAQVDYSETKAHLLVLILYSVSFDILFITQLAIIIGELLICLKTTCCLAWICAIPWNTIIDSTLRSTVHLSLLPPPLLEPHWRLIYLSFAVLLISKMTYRDGKKIRWQGKGTLPRIFNWRHCLCSTTVRPIFQNKTRRKKRTRHTKPSEK